MSEELSLNLEGTTPIEDNAGDISDKGSATAPQEQNPEVSTEGGEVTPPNTESEPYMTIRYRHEDKPLTQEEATVMAQKGYAYDDLYKKLQRAASLQGKDVSEFIDGFEKAQDDAHRAELEAKYGDDTDTINALMELYQSKKEGTVKAAEQEFERQNKEKQSSIESRLADEFIELQKEFPEITDFASLPKSVKTAAADGKHLLDAYLRFSHTEQKKINAAKASADAAKKASAGNLSSADKTSHSDEMSALMEGLYG